MVCISCAFWTTLVYVHSSCFMGIELKYKPAEGTLSLSQTKYITDAFEKFCGQSTKVYKTPGQDRSFTQSARSDFDSTYHVYHKSVGRRPLKTRPWVSTR